MLFFSKFENRDCHTIDYCTIENDGFSLLHFIEDEYRKRLYNVAKVTYKNDKLLSEKFNDRIVLNKKNVRAKNRTTKSIIEQKYFKTFQVQLINFTIFC